MLPIFYENNVMDPKMLSKVISESLEIPWCLPPAGIPGNHPPRNVGVLGDGSTIKHRKNKLYYSKPENYPIVTSYPLYQCAKNSSAIYKMRPISKYISKLILHLRTLVKKHYRENVINVDKMFNVVVCNYYTQDRHQISAHCDDERWLEKNQLNSEGIPSASIIASLSLYVDQIPETLRNFEIFDSDKNSWEKYNLEHNSILFFSNHKHRAKSIGKKGHSCKRINLTFRTLTTGLLGLTGYGNFYRYMSLPYQIKCRKQKHVESSRNFQTSIENSNTFHGKNKFQSVDIISCNQNTNEKKTNSFYQKLPRYVKSLCTLENCTNFPKTHNKNINKLIT